MPERRARAKDVSLPIDFIRQCFAYDPKTGSLFWRRRPLEHFDTARAHRIFNTQRAGNEAFAKVGAHGYRKAKLRYGGVTFHLLAHRVAWAIHTGAWPVDEIDHRDRDTTNTRFANLREATRNLNGFNRQFRPNLTGATGVRLAGSRYSAAIRFGGKKQYLGTFDTLEAASQAYQRAARRVHGHGARS